MNLKIGDRVSYKTTGDEDSAWFKFDGQEGTVRSSTNIHRSRIVFDKPTPAGVREVMLHEKYLRLIRACPRHPLTSIFK